MNLAELYSLSSGQKLDKIHTFEKYYPGLPSNYIVIQPWSKPSKNYSFWDEVLDLIYPILQKNNISLVQVGGPNEKQLKYCIQTQGTTNWGQLEYIISKARLVLCTDSVSAHLAGHYNTPLVDLISNNFSQCVAPFYGDKLKQIILEPDRINKNPSFSLDEGQNKQIDEIKPEDIANSVLKLLNIDFNYQYKTIQIGQHYSNKLLESAVDSVIDLKKLGANQIVMRLDINNNLVILQNQLSLNPCQIFTDQPIPIEILQRFRQNILGVVYIIKENNNPEFIKVLIENKIGYQLISDLPIEKLNPIKLDYLDYGVIIPISKEIPEKLKNIDLSKVYVKTSKLLLSKGKFYNSFQSYINGTDFNPQKNEPIKIDIRNINLLWNESDFCLFLEKI